jgi:hypothetical protein
MLRKESLPSGSVSVRSRRRGNVSMFLLLFMGLTVPTMFMMINVWRVTEGKVQQQRFGDAAVLAAVIELARETTKDPIYSPLLYGDPNDILSLCQDACIAEAQKYAAMNFVDGAVLKLDTMPGKGDVNFKDVKFGKFDFNDAKAGFVYIDPATATTEERRAINAVRVEAFRTTARKNSIRLFGPAWTGASDAQIVTRSTAALDRRVIGFFVQKNMAAMPTPLGFEKIPLAPVVLLNDASPLSWSQMVEAPADLSKSPIPYGQMIVNIPTQTFPSGPPLNSQLLDIGIGTAAEMATQLTGGITALQASALKNGLILDSTSFTVPVPTYTPLPDGDTTSGSDFDKLYQAFLFLKNNKIERAWPLCGILPASGTDATVTGFVAARVIDVQIRQHGGSSPTNFIQLTLQPTLLETPTAFTDYSNRFLKTTSPPSPNAGPPSPYAAYSRIVNPYLCRVRLID